jgi:uncharacterized membrane protein
MTLSLGLGLLLSGISLVHLIDIVRRRGERFEYASAMFTGELGLMFVVSESLPRDRLGLVVVLAFGLSMLSTMVVWVILFRRYKRQSAA